jgi:outer membrane lipoprotein SlyB
MFNLLKIVFILLMASQLAGCYTAGGYQPTVDTYNDPNASRLSQDMEECRQLAEQSAGGSTAKEAAVGTGIGALIGAASGALIGAILGNPGTGAAVGAATGGISGGARQGFQGEDRYRNAYNQCLSGRGHHVIR